MSEEGDSNEQEVSNDDDLVDPNKAKHKIIRVLTVIAYTLSVSMAAILLSIYYVFMWDGHPTLARKDPSHGHPASISHHQIVTYQLPEPPPVAGNTLSTSVTKIASPVPVNLQIQNQQQPNYDEDIGTEDNVLVDVPYEPTAIPVVEAKTEALPSTPDALILDGDDNMQDTEWSMSVNNTYTHLSEIAKRSPILKKLISNSIVD